MEKEFYLVKGTNFAHTFTDEKAAKDFAAAHTEKGLRVEKLGKLPKKKVDKKPEK